MDLAAHSPDAAKGQLAAEVLRSFGEVRLRVTGSSMLPAIWPRDILVIQHCSIDEARAGEVLLFSRHGRLFAHRMVARSGSRIVTRGDSLPAPDPAVNAAQLLGRVRLVLRGGKPVRLPARPGLLGRMTATLVSRSATAARLLTRFHALRGSL